MKSNNDAGYYFDEFMRILNSMYFWERWMICFLMAISPNYVRYKANNYFIQKRSQMNYTQKNFNKVFRDITLTETLIDFGIALLTIATFPFMIFCLIIRPIIFKEIKNKLNTDSSTKAEGKKE